MQVSERTVTQRTLGGTRQLVIDAVAAGSGVSLRGLSAMEARELQSLAQARGVIPLIEQLPDGWLFAISENSTFAFEALSATN